MLWFRARICTDWLCQDGEFTNFGNVFLSFSFLVFLDQFFSTSVLKIEWDRPATLIL